VDAQIESDLKLDLPFPDVFGVEEDVILKRAEQFAAVDPYPSIPAALLSTAHLISYVAATGMVHPFRVTPGEFDKTLKPASHCVALNGDYIYWSRSGGEYRRHEGAIADGEELTLLPNTITYVTLEPYFRLPRYIALRFNLKIRDIYRGLLVGTGPLVDPGFTGRLSVPLHNLTSNTYTIVGGDPLVWMEFTKVSGTDGWRDATPAEQPATFGFYLEMPRRKKEATLRDYLRRAHPDPIVSSIPAAIGDAQAAAESARADAEKSRATIRNISLLGALSLVIAIAAVLVPTWSLINDANSRSDDLARQVETLEQKLANQQDVNAQQAREIVRLQSALRPRQARP
jgi:deoxycytidine triphosphate deaminase